MREAGIKNEDVMSVVKDKTNFKRQPAYEFDSNRPKEVVDLAEGKTSRDYISASRGYGSGYKN